MNAYEILKCEDNKKAELSLKAELEMQLVNLLQLPVLCMERFICSLSWSGFKSHTVGWTGQGWQSIRCFLCVCLLLQPCLTLSTSLSRQIPTGNPPLICLTVLVLDFGMKTIQPSKQAALPCPNSTILHLFFHFFYHSSCSHGIRLITTNKEQAAAEFVARFFEGVARRSSRILPSTDLNWLLSKCLKCPIYILITRK